MAKSLFSRILAKVVQGFGSKPGIIGFSFTTGADGTPTMVTANGADYRGLITVVQDTNDYTVTLPGTWGLTRAITVDNSIGATVNCTPSSTPGSGTLTLAFSATLASATVNVIVLLEGDLKGN